MVLQRVEADLKEVVQGPKVPRLMSQADHEGCPVGCGLTCRDEKEKCEIGDGGRMCTGVLLYEEIIKKY